MSATPSNDLAARFERAFALHRDGRDADALAMYDAVLAADPGHAPALHFSALVLHRQSRGAEALARIERSLAVDPSVSDVWSNAGLIFGDLGRHGDAVRALERAVELDPDLAEAWINLSSQRLADGDAVGAEVAARRAAALAPMRTAWFNLALALVAQRRDAAALEAIDVLDAGVEDPTFDPALAGLRAQLLVATGDRDGARQVLDRALARGDLPMLRFERAHIAELQGDVAAAIADYHALLGPSVGNDATRELALSELIFLCKQRVVWDGLAPLQAAFRQRVALHARDGSASGLTPFSFLSDPSTRAEQRAAAEASSRHHPAGPPPTRALSTGRLRIGYLSADLHAHATGVLAVGLFERHDRDRFEVFAYSTGPDDGSALRRRLVAAFDHFVDAAGWSAARLAGRIATDGIDILVDLKGHTAGSSIDVMAMRPAPITVSYLGYPGTMGAWFIDYLIGDRVVTPLAHATDYSETLVHLPHCYQINDDRREIGVAPTRAEVGLPPDAVVLCCFNQTYKINADVLDVWADILRRAPQTVLWLLARESDGGVRERLVHELVSRGVEGDRIVFAAHRAHADYLALYRLADLFVDTWPYNAHTTASDALWAGCPLLTIAGDTFAGRVAASLLGAVGLTAGIAPDRANYVALAIAWAGDRARLAAMRRQLEASVRTSPLFDTAGTTRAIEAAYLAMADQFRRGQRETILLRADDASSA